MPSARATSGKPRDDRHWHQRFLDCGMAAVFGRALRPTSSLGCERHHRTGACRHQPAPRGPQPHRRTARPKRRVGVGRQRHRSCSDGRLRLLPFEPGGVLCVRCRWSSQRSSPCRLVSPNDFALAGYGAQDAHEVSYRQSGSRACEEPLAVAPIGEPYAFFIFANASILPLVANIITLRASDRATALVALCIIGPQIVVTFASPRIGLWADRHGRRPLFLLGFAALPVRAALLALSSDPKVLVAIQILDGLSGAALGVLVASSVADLTRHSGNFNLALGLTGIAMGVGAAVSTALGGAVAYRFGVATAFMMLSLIGLLGFFVYALTMPETRHPESDPADEEEMDTDT